ncbi:hypothetical protein LRM36_00210 [Stenotrophomonas maltophilia]|nr:hypothetical protein [Stenotrophomonas maltophilia]
MINAPTLLAAAVMACCAPLAVSAAEATLSPASNGGSGHMPSGYHQLNFHIGNGDWAGDLRLPVAPTAGDRVTVMSDAIWSARLDLAGTAFATAGGAPFLQGTLLDLRWNAGTGQWDVQDGGSARALTAPNLPSDRIANSYHLLTQYSMADGSHTGELRLPYWAPDNALLTVVNRATWKTRVNLHPYSARGDWQTCTTGQNCTYTYVASKMRWVEVVQGDNVTAAQALPFPSSALSRVVLNPAFDVVETLFLPAKGVHGDVYTFLDPHGISGHSIGTTHTTLQQPVQLRQGKEVRMRFNAMYGAWDLLP